MKWYKVEAPREEYRQNLGDSVKSLDPQISEAPLFGEHMLGFTDFKHLKDEAELFDIFMSQGGSHVRNE